MKVVLFCGGFGLRIREPSSEIPKPMFQIGDRPVLWHVMKYYAYYGHKDFILCLGYQADVIKQYFLTFKDVKSTNFILSDGGKEIRELPSDVSDWTITCVDTGLHTSIGQRLKQVQPYIADDEFFLANYGDTLTDAPLDEMIEDLTRDPHKTACFLCVRPTLSVHVISFSGVGRKRSISRIDPMKAAEIWINGGYFTFRREVFAYLKKGNELVPDALRSLMKKDKLIAWCYEGFHAPMDTLKDMRFLNQLYATGQANWAKWEGTA